MHEDHDWLEMTVPSHCFSGEDDSVMADRIQGASIDAIAKLRTFTASGRGSRQGLDQHGASFGRLAAKNKAFYAHTSCAKLFTNNRRTYSQQSSINLLVIDVIIPVVTLATLDLVAEMAPNGGVDTSFTFNALQLMIREDSADCVIQNMSRKIVLHFTPYHPESKCPRFEWIQTKNGLSRHEFGDLSEVDIQFYDYLEEDVDENGETLRVVNPSDSASLLTRASWFHAAGSSLPMQFRKYYDDHPQRRPAPVLTEMTELLTSSSVGSMTDDQQAWLDEAQCMSGQVYSIDTRRTEEVNAAFVAQVGSMTMTSIASTSMSALLQLPACTESLTSPTMHLRTAGQFKDGELMDKITSALKLGVQSLREFADAHSVTWQSLRSWIRNKGRPGWKRLKELHGPTVTPTAPKKTTKKRKAVAKPGGKQKKKKR